MQHKYGYVRDEVLCVIRKLMLSVNIKLYTNDVLEIESLGLTLLSVHVSCVHVENSKSLGSAVHRK